MTTPNIEKLGKRYQPKMRAVLRDIAKRLRADGFIVSAPFDLTDEEYRWDITVSVKGNKDRENIVSVSLTLTESIVRDGMGEEYGRGEKYGISFLFDIVAYGGLMLGSVAVGNYSPSCFVPANDQDAIETRWAETISFDLAQVSAIIGRHISDREETK